MRKNFLIILFWFTVIFFVCGCGKNAHDESKQSRTLQMTGEEVWEKLDELSVGLETMYDDMKGFTLYRCRYNTDENVNIVPYVLVYDDYSVSLRYHVLYSGREPLHFDTLYIKTNAGVKKEKYKDVSILYGYNVVEEFNGAMSKEVYDTLKEAIAEGHAKIRLEGWQMEERNLTLEELEEFKKVFSIYEFLNGVKVEE